MLPHLHSLLQWDLLSDMPFFRVGKTTPLIMRSGKCNKIHVLNKNDQKKIDNRKYIDENDICGDSRCNTDTTICVVNKNNEFKFYFNCKVNEINTIDIIVNDPKSLFDLKKGLNKNKRSIVLKSIAINIQ